MPKGSRDQESRQFLSSNTVYARTLMGMTQEQLAELAELDRTQISAIERMTSGASVDSVGRLARAVSVPTYVMMMPPTEAHPRILSVVQAHTEKRAISRQTARKPLRVRGKQRGPL